MNAAEGVQQDLLATLIQEHSDRLRGLLWGILRNWDEVDDALQSTIAKALESNGNVRDAAWKAWLFQVAYNEAMLLKRKQGVRQRAIERVIAQTPEPDEVWPGDQLADRETASRVAKELEQLPRDQREVVLRRMHGDQTFSEIAAELGLPLGTVLTRMRLATEKLRKALRDL